MINKNILVAITILLISGCAPILDPKKYMEEQEKLTGYSNEGMDQICQPKFSSSTSGQIGQLQEMQRCAAVDSGKFIDGRTITKYSELKNGINNVCQFLGFSRDLVPDRLSKKIGILKAIAKPDFSTGKSLYDKELTSRLHYLLTNKLGMKLAPVEQTERLFNLELAYFEEKNKKPAGPIADLLLSNNDKSEEKLYYDAILSKFPEQAYLIDVSNSFDADEMYRVMQYQIGEIQKNEHKKDKIESFSKREYEDFLGILNYATASLNKFAFENRNKISMKIMLFEQMQNAKKRGMLQVNLLAEPGCTSTNYQKMIDQLTEAEYKKQKSDEEGKTGTKGVIKGLTESLYINDSENGISIGIDERRAWGSNLKFTLERYQDARNEWIKSLNDLVVMYDQNLIPFVGDAFVKMKISGYLASSQMQRPLSSRKVEAKDDVPQVQPQTTSVNTGKITSPIKSTNSGKSIKPKGKEPIKNELKKSQ